MIDDGTAAAGIDGGVDLELARAAFVDFHGAGNGAGGDFYALAEHVGQRVTHHLDRRGQLDVLIVAQR